MKIRGYGGGGKGGGAASTVASIMPDSLRSKAYARVLDLVSEGEIEGLVDGAKSIYLDDTPLQNPDGSYNFGGATWVTRSGTQSQSYIPGFPTVENTTNVGVEVKYSASVTRQFTNPNLNAVRVTIGVPQLTLQDTASGSVSGTTVGIAIDVQTNGGGFVRQNLNGAETITGKTTSRYQRSFLIPLTGTGPWDVRVVRLTADSTQSNLQNKTIWDTVTEIVDSKLRYPNSAIVGLSVDASQFSSIPSRAYDMKLLRVRVPSNYNPTTRTYTGSWDGTFQIAWTDNPAWCFYDLVTADRYGLGDFIDPTQVDKWALYAIGQYCDALVPDGLGGQEPRFTCNVYMQTRQEAYKVLSDLASIFRGMAFWSSGSITAIQDAPTTAAYLYTAANVIDGVFTYSGSSAKARHTVALVTWNDPSDRYTQKVEYVEDADGIARYGVITTEIAAIGCTSRGQAHRAGRWLLYSERLETETVSFKTGIEGMICRPGQVIKVADPVRAGVRYGGRIVTTGTSSITIDAPVTLTAGQAYTLATLKADGTVQETSVSHSGGTLSTLNVSPAFGETPAQGGVWILTSAAVNPQTFRVISVAENERNEFEVVALAHDPSKFGAVENNLKLEARSFSVLTAVPAQPQNLQVTEALYLSGTAIKTRLQVSWSPVATATSYVVTYQQSYGNRSPEIVTTTPSLDLQEIEDGQLYTISVRAVNALSTRGPEASTTYQVIGKATPPQSVQNFYVARNGNVLNFVWQHVTDVDLDRYELRLGQVWNTATQIGSTAANSFAFTTQRGGTFLIKAVDTSGNYSLSEAAVIVADVSGINVVLDYNDSIAGFPGTHDNTFQLGITQSKQWADLGSWDSAGTWDDSSFKGGVTLVGDKHWSDLTGTWASYTAPWIFTDPIEVGAYVTAPIDIGFIATSTLAIECSVETLAKSNPPWSDFTDPWASYAAPEWTWQGRASAISAYFEVATSTDGTTWSQWQPFVQGAYRFRYLKVRATLSTTDLNYLPYMTKLITHIDVPDRVDHFKDVAVTTSGVTISFSPAFVGVKTVQATLQSAVSGDRYTVTGKSNSQVTIKVFDSAGAAKAGVVDVDVFGYGSLG